MNKNYFEGLKNTEKYNVKKQIYLKKRVLNTINNLIKVFFNDSLKKNQFLLDLGSSDGSLVKVAEEFGLKAKGLDINEINLENDKINLQNESCDIVTAISLIEHLYNPENLLAEVKRVLKKNAYLIIVTPNWSSNTKTFFDDPTHVHPYTIKSLKFLLEYNGFKKIEVLPWLVNKPGWMWKFPFKFLLAKIIPFRGDANKWIPNFLKGKSNTLLSICIK